MRSYGFETAHAKASAIGARASVECPLLVAKLKTFAQYKFFRFWHQPDLPQGPISLGRGNRPARRVCRSEQQGRQGATRRRLCAAIGSRSGHGAAIAKATFMTQTGRRE